jgi:hypothetical protein
MVHSSHTHVFDIRVVRGYFVDKAGLDRGVAETLTVTGKTYKIEPWATLGTQREKDPMLLW